MLRPKAPCHVHDQAHDVDFVTLDLYPQHAHNLRDVPRNEDACLRCIQLKVTNVGYVSDTEPLQVVHCRGVALLLLKEVGAICPLVARQVLQTFVKGVSGTMERCGNRSES